ncbi:helix-turn-helix transcriptional regulator [uncultured Sphaerochaeta sp.]|uniref:PadR family transcriptional regulator n=1 Tax=uncultured Sphaerochaeta sp. TaxID=886478 RepID=UPI002A0A294C|nr:helix-turn-helix transcriptional regulator [uncultured Sphaerochaeta sp.]
MDEEQMMNNLVTELKRGTLALCVLSQLKTPQYGYSLLQLLKENDIDIEANTLYPLLRRLETQGLLTSIWNTSENRPRKFYQLNEQGENLYILLLTEWKESTMHISRLIRGNHNE